MGTVCEMRVDVDDAWEAVTIEAYSTKGDAVMTRYNDHDDDGIEAWWLETSLEFRPIRTERERFKDAVKAAMPDDRYHVGDWNTVDWVAGVLYDAGFRAPDSQTTKGE